MTKGNAKNSTDMINAINSLNSTEKAKFLSKFGLSGLNASQMTIKMNTIYSHYDQKLRSSYDNLYRIDADTKQMKAERKNFKEMLDARENAKNNK